MLFQTPQFAILLATTLAAFYWLPRRYRLTALGVSSLFFYTAGGLLDLALLIATLFASWALSLKVRPGGPRWPLVVGVALLLSSLAYFKYSHFLYENVNAVASSVGLPAIPIVASTILPLGISFYTFQIIAYLIDLWKGRTEPARSLWHYVVFIIFFGQLIAGPIMRAKDYIGQLVDGHGARSEDFRLGGLLILTGLTKKVVIADWLASQVDGRFAQPLALSQADTWLAAYFFAFQIYFDFSGYVDIALGLGRLFGLRLSENFRTPYLSRHPREFWSRWHITLASWFRDYLYIPLGGNRYGRLREIASLMLVMTVAGLWHGAGWTLILWGAVHGSYLAVSRFIPTQRLQSLLPVPEAMKGRLYTLVAVAIFFHLTVLAWIPFRASDLTTALLMWRQAFTFDSASAWISMAPHFAVVSALYGLHIVERIARERTSAARLVWRRVPGLLRGAAYAVALLFVVMRSGSNQSFIYFRF